MAQSNVKFRVDARDAVRQIRELASASGRLGKEVLRSQRSFGGLQGVLTKLALVETGRRFTMLAANFKQTQIRLRLLSKEYGENAKAQALAARAASRFGLSQQEALSGITDIYARLRPIGISLKQIETTYMGFNIATKLAGVSAAQASGAFLQLSQALGSGRLQGDEYRSIAEQLPTLTQAIAKEMGKPIGQLKKLASEGKVTSDIVIAALKTIEQEGGSSIGALMKEDPTQQFKNLQNAISDLSTELGEYLLPSVVAVTQAITEVVKWVADLPSPVKATGVAIAGVTTAVGVLAPLMYQSLRTLRIIRVFLLRKFIPAIGLTKAAMGPIALLLSGITVAVALAGEAYADKKQKVEDYTKALESQNVASINELILAKKKAIQEKTDFIERRIKQRRGIGAANLPQARREIEKLEQEIAELNKRLTEIPGELAAENLAKANEAMKALGESTRQTSEQFKNAFSSKFQNYLTTVNDFGAQAGAAVVKAFQGMEDALVSFVQTGKLNFKELANSIIADLIRIHVRQAFIAPLANMTGKWFSGFSGGTPAPVGNKMGGGLASAGTSYLVGERGPEIFTPNSSGTITANDQLGGGMVINVDASGSAVEGDANKSRELGELIGAAVQAEIGRQQRPGGMLY